MSRVPLMPLRRGQRVLRGLLGAVAAAATAGAAAAPPRSPTSPISAAAIRRTIATLGDDALAGRRTGSPGGNQAAAFIAAELARAGLRPAGDDGTYLQRVPVHASTPLPDSFLLLVSPCRTRPLALGEEYLLFTSGLQTWLPQPVQVVFAGWGIVAPEFDYNDYQGLDVRGRIVAYLAGEPASADPAFFDGDRTTVHTSPEVKQRTAISRGALGSILLPLGDPGRWERTRRDFSFEHLVRAANVPRHLSLVLHPAVIEELFCGARHSFGEVRGWAAGGGMRSFPLATAVEFRGSFRTRDFLASNVVAVLPGGDADLAREAVVVSAHYDHLGVGTPVRGDAIYNGVVDNALGVAGVLEIARALARGGALRRSVVFLFPTGEEQGLIGSSTYVDRPAVPLSRTVAAVNVDGLAHHDAFRDVVVIGGDLSTLGTTVAAVAARAGLAVSEPPPRLAAHEAFARSDQVAFAEAGIPSMLVNEGFDWVHHTPEEAMAITTRWLAEVYHSPADDLSQDLDLDAAARHAALILEVVRQLADQDETPSWRPGSPYAAIRLRSAIESR